MPRAQFRDAIFVRQPGDLLRSPPQGLAALYNVGTLNLIGETIYADDSSGTTLPNPIPIGEDGVLEFWLSEERELDIVTNCAGFLENRSTVTTDGVGPPSQGAVGPPGGTGPTGPQGLPGTSIVWLGAWSSSTPYVVDNAVSDHNSSYLCVAPVTGGSGPATDLNHWALLAAGVTGPAGVQGVRGSLWYSDDGGPNGLVGAVNQDHYLDLVTGDVWRFVDETGTTYGAGPYGSGPYGL